MTLSSRHAYSDLFIRDSIRKNDGHCQAHTNYIRAPRKRSNHRGSRDACLLFRSMLYYKDRLSHFVEQNHIGNPLRLTSHFFDTIERHTKRRLSSAQRHIAGDVATIGVTDYRRRCCNHACFRVGAENLGISCNLSVYTYTNISEHARLNRKYSLSR